MSGEPEAKKLLGLWCWVATPVFVIHMIFAINNSIQFLISVAVISRFPVRAWWSVVDVRQVLLCALGVLTALIVVSCRNKIWLAVFLHVMLIATLSLLDAYPLRNIRQAQKVERYSLIYAGKNVEFAEHAGGKNLRYWELTAALLRAISNYAVLLGLAHGAMYFKLRESERKDAENLKLSIERLRHLALCNRLQPHFLYNTLNSLVTLIGTDSERAQQCLIRLNHVLRHSIDALPQQETDIETELEILKSYLEIQKVRFGQRFNYEIDFEDSVADCLIPAFLLQPLVENSFQHGFKANGNRLRIEVRVSREAKYCKIEIMDDGVETSSLLPFKEGNGIGLTRERLELQYKGKADVRFSAVKPLGLSTTVRIPLEA